VGKWPREYPLAVAKAKAEGAETQRSDETGLRSDDVRGSGYALNGQTPVVVAQATR
jgi:hypothetical protein